MSSTEVAYALGKLKVAFMRLKEGFWLRAKSCSICLKTGI